MKKHALLKCGVKRIASLRNELAQNGLSLRNTSGETQRQMLLRVLEYLGPRGLNTPEGTGLGYLRLATRISELEDEGCIIASRREAIIGADGLAHVGVARYALLGRREGGNPQLQLDLGAA